MSYCLQPTCRKPQNQPKVTFCQNCGSKLLLRERYRALKVIGQGGFGKTFLAVDEDKPSKPRCVIKQFYPQAQGTDNAQKASELFDREAIRLDDLGKHSQIPELLAHFTQDEQQYLVQEYIEGQNLAQILETKINFDTAEIHRLLNDLLPVLDFIHANNVIHRDIKPENIIQTKDGKNVLVDFGAAKYATGTALVKTGTTIGTALYIAPEQARGKAIFASDLYSLGVSCIHLLTGISPFELFDIGENVWVWRDYLVDNLIEDSLGEVIDKLIENAVNRRYQSAKEAIAELYSNNPQYKGRSMPIVAVNPIFSLKAPITTLQTNSIMNFSINPTGFMHPASPLETFEFESVSLSITGRIIDKECHRAEFFTEDLGSGIVLEMIFIPGGTLIMGSPETEEGHADHERPQHKVNITPFLLSKYPITQQQWEVIIGDNSCRFRDERRPVETVSWYDADDFCRILSRRTKRNYHLPSEAQWEYAARAGTKTPFHFGETITTEVANFNGDSYGIAPKGANRQESSPVGIFPANQFGLYDMHGNVWEWCADPWHENYQGAPADGSVWELGQRDASYLLRGGSWQVNPRDCRSSFRRRHDPREKQSDIGFRVAIS